MKTREAPFDRELKGLSYEFKLYFSVWPFALRKNFRSGQQPLIPYNFMGNCPFPERVGPLYKVPKGLPEKHNPSGK